MTHKQMSEEIVDFCTDRHGFEIAPGIIVLYEDCNCFPMEFCDPAYGLLYNFDTGEFNMSPGIVNLCDLCVNPVMYDFSRCKFVVKHAYLPKTNIRWIN